MIKLKHLRLLTEIMTLILIYFLNLMKEVEEVILKNCLKENVDWMLESLFMVIGLLTSGIVCLIVVLTVVH